MRRFLTLFFMFSFIVISIASAKEPTYVKEKELYTQFSMDFNLPTKTYYNGSSEAMPSQMEREYSEDFYRLSLTYGLMEKLNFDFGLRVWSAHKSFASEEVQREKYNLSEAAIKSDIEKTRLLDFEVGFRLLLKDYFFKHSVAASIFIPASNKVDPQPYDIGDGRFALKVRYLFEKDFGPHLVYGDTGFVFNDERPESQYVLEANYAYFIIKDLYAGLGLGMSIPLSMDDNTNPFETVAQDIGSFNLIARVGYSPIEKLNVELLYNYTMGGFNTFLFNTICLNISYLF